MDSPWFYVAGLVVAPFVFRMWWQDLRAGERGEELPSPLPGATPVGKLCLVVAVLGSLIILANEVVGEYQLGVVEQQSTMTLLFCAYSVLVAPLIEELIFRGFLVYDKGSRAMLIGGIVLVSLIFALAHGHIWSYSFSDGASEPDFGTKALFSTAILAINSLWWYTVRFSVKLNPRHSLLPCFVAHSASNLGVVLVKAFQGKVDGLW